MASKQLGFLINQDRCIGCQACEIACKQEYHVDIGIRWRKVTEVVTKKEGELSYTFLPLACNHCEKPECLRVCPVGAYSKRKDGIVVHDQKRCIGCRMCVMACPYGAPHYNKENGTAEKCQLCYQRIDAGMQPACIAACPVEAMSIIDINNSKEIQGTVEEVPGFRALPAIKPAVRFVPPKNGKIRRGRG